MTRQMASKSTAIAAMLLCLLCGGFVVTSWAAPPAGDRAGYELSQKVDFKIGAKQLRDGDDITIDEIQGTSSTIAAGNVYVIKGTYRLGSAANAQLAAYVGGAKSGKQEQEESEKELVIRKMIADYIAESRNHGTRPAMEAPQAFRRMIPSNPPQNTQMIEVERGEGRLFAGLLPVGQEHATPQLLSRRRRRAFRKRLFRHGRCRWR